MKRLIRLLIVSVALLMITEAAQAQNSPAVDTDPIPERPHCVKVTLKNLNAAAIVVGFIELTVYDPARCERLCSIRFTVPKDQRRIRFCQIRAFEICCQQSISPLPGYIYRVRVLNPAGALLVTDWLFAP